MYNVQGDAVRKHRNMAKIPHPAIAKAKTLDFSADLSYTCICMSVLIRSGRIFHLVFTC